MLIFLYIGKKFDYIKFKIEKLLKNINKELGIKVEYNPIIVNDKVPKNIEKKIGHML